MGAALPRVRSLQCCCCGTATRGRQWWNRDAGFGICDRCAADEAHRSSAQELRQRYGEPGVHYALDPAS